MLPTALLRCGEGAPVSTVVTWYAQKSDEHELYWGHGGSDPGVNTDVRLRLSDSTAAIVFTNTNGILPSEATEQIMLESENL